MKKRGQIYILAALIIVGLIVGFAGVTNYLKSEESVKIYDLKAELGIESEQVLDHGIYDEKNTIQMNKLLKDFTQNYSEYVGEGFRVYFVFGNEEEIVVAGFRDLVTGEISYELGATKTSLKIRKKIYDSETIQSPEIGKEKKVKVKIEGKDYEFGLGEQDNFYFVIHQKTEEGIFVERNE